MKIEGFIMNQLADFILKHQSNIEQAVVEKREDLCVQKTGGTSSGHAFVSDPTCQKAIRNIMPVGAVVVYYGPKVGDQREYRVLKHPEKWIAIANHTWKHYRGTTAGKVMELRYRQGQTRMHLVAKELNISFQRCYILLDLVHRYMIDNAKGLGAYEVKSKQHSRLESILNFIQKKEQKNEH